MRFREVSIKMGLLQCPPIYKYPRYCHSVIWLDRYSCRQMRLHTTVRCLSPKNMLQCTIAGERMLSNSFTKALMQSCMPQLLLMEGWLSYSITVTGQWARWRPKSPASQLFTEPLIQAYIKENNKPPRHWPLWGDFTVDRWIPHTNGQWRGKCLHLMTSSCMKTSWHRHNSCINGHLLGDTYHWWYCPFLMGIRNDQYVLCCYSEKAVEIKTRRRDLRHRDVHVTSQLFGIWVCVGLRPCYIVLWIQASVEHFAIGHTDSKWKLCCHWLKDVGRHDVSLQVILVIGLVCSTSLMTMLIRSVGGLSKYFYRGLCLVDLNADVIGQSINRCGVA